MKQTLEQNLQQQLTITPQLRQSIHLLQLSTLELQKTLQDALESNPLLENEDMLDKQLVHLADAFPTESPTYQSDEFDAKIIDTLSSDNNPLDWSKNISTNSNYSSTTSSSDVPVYEGQTQQTLHDYLLWQVELTPFSEQDHAIALVLIDEINEQGYLNTSLDEVLNAFDDPTIELSDIEIVLKRIQHFDPIGVGARNLAECLLRQLDELPISTPYLDASKYLIKHHQLLLEKHDIKTLLKITQWSEQKLKQTLQLIRTLVPYPGECFEHNTPQYTIPDLFVYKHKNTWHAALNEQSLPHLHINQDYLQVNLSKSDQHFIASHMQQADWLIKSLNYRNETLLKVCQCIVDMQQDFFEYGAEKLKPMTLMHIAEQLALHESTISRATTQKYLHCPKGLFELKYFFSSHISKENGEDTSSTAIRVMIKKLIAQEESRKPLSDSKIMELLNQQGILVARRTVAKYREMLSIPPSSQRKKLT